MGHDDGADQTGGDTPRGLVDVLLLIVLIGELNVESLGEAVTEVVGGTGLQCLTVVHQSLDAVGSLGTGELVALGLATLDNGHSQILLTELGVDVQHLLGLDDGLLGGGVDGVTLLPQELTGAQERTGGLFPTYHADPLVVQLGQVAVGMDDIGEVLAEQGLGGGTHAQALLQLLAAAEGDPSHLGSEALYVILLLLQ